MKPIQVLLRCFAKPDCVYLEDLTIHLHWVRCLEDFLQVRCQMNKFPIVLVTFKRQDGDTILYLVPERTHTVVDDEHLVQRPVLYDPQVFDCPVVSRDYTLLRMLQCSL